MQLHGSLLRPEQRARFPSTNRGQPPYLAEKTRESDITKQFQRLRVYGFVHRKGLGVQLQRIRVTLSLRFQRLPIQKTPEITPTYTVEPR